MYLSHIDIKDAAYRLVKSSPLPLLISGEIYKDTRPLNSEKEDISISVLSGNVAQIQEFLLNVNLFVPDIRRGNEDIEDTARLRVLAQECIKAFSSNVQDDRIWFSLDSQSIMAVEDMPFHFINNRIRAKCLTI